MSHSEQLTDADAGAAAIQAAGAILRQGGIVCHATEGVWGLACDPLNDVAVQRLLALKQRQPDKGLLLIGARASVFSVELAQHTPQLAARVRASWPGPSTWVLPNQHYSAWVTGGRATVACRVPGHAQARALCAEFGGALVSTSANRSGQPAITEQGQALAEFGAEVDLVLPGQVLQPGSPSTLYSLTGEILR